ncbi:hypothetical protein PG984_007832 [Apiospora sp. TS-2023a]
MAQGHGTGHGPPINEEERPTTTRLWHRHQQSSREIRKKDEEAKVMVSFRIRDIGTKTTIVTLKVEDVLSSQHFLRAVQGFFGGLS